MKKSPEGKAVALLQARFPGKELVLILVTPGPEGNECSISTSFPIQANRELLASTLRQLASQVSAGGLN